MKLLQTPLIERFIVSVPGRLQELRDVILQRNAEDVRRVAHKFRGSASTFGFPQIAAIIKGVEEVFLRQQVSASVDMELLGQFNRLVKQCTRMSTRGFVLPAETTALLLLDESSVPHSREPHRDRDSQVFDFSSTLV